MQRTLILSMLCLAGTVAAQGERLDLQDDVPIDTYLALLAQVAPPARDGAEAYMAAFRSRCGRALRTIELRRAFAQGNGDPGEWISQEGSRPRRREASTSTSIKPFPPAPSTNTSRFHRGG